VVIAMNVPSTHIETTIGQPLKTQKNPYQKRHGLFMQRLDLEVDVIAPF
jgi:hypothetical protein